MVLPYLYISHSRPWGLVTPFGDIDLGQHWLRKWLVAWRHQAITWTNVDLSSVRSSGIYLRAISYEIPQPPFIKFSLKITYLKLIWNLPGANELKSVNMLIIMGMLISLRIWLNGFESSSVTYIIHGTQWCIPYAMTLQCTKSYPKTKKINI